MWYAAAVGNGCAQHAPPGAQNQRVEQQHHCMPRNWMWRVLTGLLLGAICPCMRPWKCTDDRVLCMCAGVPALRQTDKHINGTQGATALSPQLCSPLAHECSGLRAPAQPGVLAAASRSGSNTHTHTTDTTTKRRPGKASDTYKYASQDSRCQCPHGLPNQASIHEHTYESTLPYSGAVLVHARGGAHHLNHRQQAA